MSTDNYQRFFVEADTDGSGYLTLEELTDILEKRGYKEGRGKIRVSLKTE